MKSTIAWALFGAIATVNATYRDACWPSTITSYSTLTKYDYKPQTIVNYVTRESTKTVVVSYTAPPVYKTQYATVTSTYNAPPSTKTVSITYTAEQPTKTCTVTSTVSVPTTVSVEQTKSETYSTTVTATVTSYSNSGSSSSGGQCNALACCDAVTGKCSATDKACSGLRQQTRCCKCSSSNGFININAACCNDIASLDQVQALLGVVVGGHS